MPPGSATTCQGTQAGSALILILMCESDVFASLLCRGGLPGGDLHQHINNHRHASPARSDWEGSYDVCMVCHVALAVKAPPCSSTKDRFLTV